MKVKENTENEKTKKRMKKYRDKMKSTGFFQLTIWIPKNKKNEIKKIIDTFLQK
jgi:hypothetical protein